MNYGYYYNNNHQYNQQQQNIIQPLYQNYYATHQSLQNVVVAPMAMAKVYLTNTTDENKNTMMMMATNLNLRSSSQIKQQLKQNASIKSLFN